MKNYIKRGSLNIHSVLDKFLKDEVLPGLDLKLDEFWEKFEDLLKEFHQRNKDLLVKRSLLQDQISSWHRNNDFDLNEYKKFLQEIGYLEEVPDDFTITTNNIDPEISSIPGPQLVVPIMNARFALNATNARWGSLYDALYGTNVISEDGGASREGPYNEIRGDKVINFSKQFLDDCFPLKEFSYREIVNISIKDQRLLFRTEQNQNTYLEDEKQFKGFNGDVDNPSDILLVNNRLHVEIQIDPTHPVGKSDKANIKDIILESAVSTIQDCEDSVAAVDAEDKVIAYRNWLGLMMGNLSESFEKNGKQITRVLKDDRVYKDIEGNTFSLPGRSLLLVRNVGHLMQNPSVILENGDEVYEGILDAMFTICISLYDLKNLNILSNSKNKSMYIVKPKMHGSEEVAFTCDLFEAIEQIFNLEKNTVKVGIMDEERRTTINLKSCIEKAKERIIFINTGFLDRTGDEIYTSMEAGAMVPKSEMKSQAWINAYEDWNVDIGISCGLNGKAQIGKGMWAMPDEMKEMLMNKIVHPLSGATCAWVPSPTAATIHAMHYHEVDVLTRQHELSSRQLADIDKILTIPLLKEELDEELIRNEIANSAQGILGYVVRWIDQGIGCSKVPDINNVGLMEDRATCRISSQHISNWLHHGICSEEEIIDIFKEMALIVDEQNKDDPNYQKMGSNFSGFAFQASLDLALKGADQPSGYTEPLLHKWRLESKKSTP
ncbi:MAG: malate synthase G [Pseudomonadota bacterium]|nr:malate synthase G [Pseudomonadota bacterium]